MAKYEFTATHGVHLSEDGINAKAYFVEDKSAPERDSVNYKKTYRFGTEDAKLAAYLRSVEGYGIEEVKQDDKADEKPAE